MLTDSLNIRQLNSGAAASQAVEVVINQLFDSAYPKVEKKKRKRDTEGSTGGPSDAHDGAQGSANDQKKGRIDWLSLDRAIPAGPYVMLALVSSSIAPTITTEIQTILLSFSGPTWPRFSIRFEIAVSLK